MNYLRNVVSEVKLKYKAGRVVYDCITKREQQEFTGYLTQCVSIADGRPDLVLSSLHEYLSFRQPENAYGGLLLLEQLVSLCNYGFHLALAKDYDIQDRIIQLAMKRGEDEAHRKAQRLARLTLLEYSRVFVDDRELLRLSSLASSFEHRTHKSLLRCLNVQNRRVRFREVDKNDIVPISPKESLGSTSGTTARTVTPLRLSSAPEVWPCHVCTYLNAPSATRCAACETLRSMDSVAHRATPQGTPRSAPKISFQEPPPPLPEASPYSSGEDEEEEEGENGGRTEEREKEEEELLENGVCADAQRNAEAETSLLLSAETPAELPFSGAVIHDTVPMDDGAYNRKASASSTSDAVHCNSHDDNSNKNCNQSNSSKSVDGSAQAQVQQNRESATQEHLSHSLAPPVAISSPKKTTTEGFPQPADSPLDFFAGSFSPHSP
ncbi:hypothetical protein N2W54_000843 [Lotmaria passim]